MTDIINIVKYFRGCVSEEVKNSAFVNLTDDNSIRVTLAKGERLTQSFPEPVEFPESSKELLELMLSAAVDTRKELIYATAFCKQQIDGKQVNAPLLFCPCEIIRDKQGVAVHLTSETWHVNAGILALIADKSEEEVKLLMQHLPVITADIIEIAQWCQEFEQYFNIGLKALHKHQIICLTMPKASAGMLNDFDIISHSDNSVHKSSLSVINDSEKETDPPYFGKMVHSYINDLSQSQVEALDVACNSKMSAIIGAPGTGKSNTITGLATHLIANGYSVLICSKMNEAVDVVYNRLITPKNGKFPFAVRTGTKEYRKDLADLLDAIVDGKYAEYTDSLDTCYSSYTTEDLIAQEEKIKKAKNAQEQVEYYQGLVDGLQARPKSLSIDYLISRIDLISAKHKLKNAQKRANNNHYENVYLDVYRTSVFANKVSENIKSLMTVNGRRDLIMLSRMLKTGKLTDDYPIYFSRLVRNGIPCWLTTINSVSESIPCIAGLFDYVIIDEASQCDIGSCIPLLFRAKRAVIVGDNKQLKYISFMKNDKNLCYAKNFGLTDEDLVRLDYTKNSMFDFAQYYADGQPVMLKEHFRSPEAIFGFSNKKFYNGKIKNVNTLYSSTFPHIMFQNVAKLPENWVSNSEGGYSIVEQDKKYTRNFFEAKAVLNTIKDIIRSQELPDNKPRTIGVLSPFRAQVDLLQDMINHEIPLEKRLKHKILVGTAHAFQGNERDIMLNSWTIAKNSKRQSFTFINNPNLFNVSVTRAKSIVINFLSIDSIENLPDGLLKEYLLYCNMFLK